MTKREEDKISIQKISIVILLLLFYSISIVLPRSVFYTLIEEDGLIESLTAGFFLVTSLSFFILFFKGGSVLRKDLLTPFTTISSRYFFLILAFIFFFGFGEEISWGQRIFNFDTPEFIAKSNTQKEFTIHNLELFDGKDMIGTPKAIFVRLFTMKQLFLYAFFFFLLMIPLLNKKFRGFNQLFENFNIPIAPIWLGWLFVGNFGVYAIIRILAATKTNAEFMHGITEIQEFNFSIVLLLLPFYWLNIKSFAS